VVVQPLPAGVIWTLSACEDDVFRVLYSTALLGRKLMDEFPEAAFSRDVRYPRHPRHRRAYTGMLFYLHGYPTSSLSFVLHVYYSIGFLVPLLGPLPTRQSANLLPKARFELETPKQLLLYGVASQSYLTTALYNHFEAAPVYICKWRAATMII
jgi:hypothetical protein